MNKRKNPFAEEDNSPPKKRKLDPQSPNHNFRTTLTTTQNINGKEAVFSINNEKRFKVGRDPSCCSIVFSNTIMVSRVHCEFIFNQNQLFIKDLNSTNGVFINNTKINTNELKPILHNDIIRFGRKTKKYNHEYTISIESIESNPSQTSNTNTKQTNESLFDIQSMLQQTVAAQLAEHSKKMEQRIAAKEEESRRIKQELHQQKMKELELKAQKQREELEQKQKEMEIMRESMERNKKEITEKLEAEKVKMEHEKEIALMEAHKKQQEELAKIAEKELETKQQEIEAQKKIKEIEEAQRKLEEEKAKQQNEILLHQKRMEIEEQKMKEKELALKEHEKKVEELNNNDGDLIEEETTCCMCYDILLAAHSLVCGHTMCHQCIREWIDSNEGSAVCPICRSEIKHDPTPCRVLDNIIGCVYFKNQSDEAKKEYEDRKKEYKEWKTAYDTKMKEIKESKNNNGWNNVAVFDWAQWADNNRAHAAAGEGGDIMEIDDDEEEEEEGEWIQSVSYSIERARSGRSTCRGCWTQIEYNTLRFGVHTAADPEHGVYYDSTHWYHPLCFARKYRHSVEAQRRENITNNAGISRRTLENTLREIFGEDEEEDEDEEEEESESDSDDDVPVNHNIRRNNERTMTIDGINFRARMNRLENLTVYQLKKYTGHNNMYVPSSMRKAALCAMIRRDIGQHI